MLNAHHKRVRVQVYCLKAIVLPINCRKMELFPKGVATDQTAPRRHPVQSHGISSHSLIALAGKLEYLLPQKLWPSKLLLENKSCMSKFDFTYSSSWLSHMTLDTMMELYQCRHQPEYNYSREIDSFQVIKRLWSPFVLFRNSGQIRWKLSTGS